MIRPLLEEWAEVASYDAPGVGDEPAVEALGSEATGRRGLEEADRRGWDSFIVAADEFGVAGASYLAAAAGDRVQGIALGHARVSNAIDGPRPALNREVLHGLQSLLRTDPRTFVRQLFKLTGGERRRVAMATRSPTSGYAASRWRWRRRFTRLASRKAPRWVSGLPLWTCRCCSPSTRAACCSPRKASTSRRRVAGRAGVQVQREAEHERRVRARAARVLHHPVCCADLTGGERSPYHPRHGADLAGRLHHPGRRRGRSRACAGRRAAARWLLPAAAREPLESA